MDPTGKCVWFLLPAAAIGGEAISGVAGHAIGATIVAAIGAWIYDQSVDDAFDDDKPEVQKPAIPDENCEDFCEQLSFAEAKAGAGVVIMTNLADEPRLISHYGAGPWVKKQHTHDCPGGKKVVIHYFHSLTTLINVELKKV